MICSSTLKASKIETAPDEVHILVPDVSRVLVRPYPDLLQRSLQDYWREIVTAERDTNMYVRTLHFL